MSWVKKDGNYNIYTSGDTLDGKSYSLLLQFLNESHAYISPSQLFSIKLPYENCTEWSDWETPKYVKLIEHGVAWALLNKVELEFIDQGSSPLFELRYRVNSWTKLCNYKAPTNHSSGTSNGAP
ncbi:hypothetical protein SAMN05192566_0534 [Methylophilus rhizosphaerae]|uniref:Uncharacterized protein n=2 Tax=Methylophilus rhizosphaerae TaxID=492660 RepID=A0A1G8ZV12_9PROT|nr:hypothetical protein SAMN05192566_0534 [Methylophilus rhizosphaerae]